jgi:hypothetical protein
MASNFKLGTTARNAAVDGMTALLNSGTIKHYTGSPPTNVSDASSGTLLATNTLNATAAGASSSGTGTFNSITSDTNAAASGTAGYFRVRASGGGDTAAHEQGTSGTASVDMVFDNATIVAGGTVAISSYTLTCPIQ